MRSSKTTAAVTAAAAAVLAVLGKAFSVGVDATTSVLMAFGMDWGHAAARAPFYFSIGLGMTGILACIGWIVSEDARRELRRKLSNPNYGKITRNHARNPEYPKQERRG